MTYGEFIKWIRGYQEKLKAPALYIQVTKDGEYWDLDIKPAPSKALQGEVITHLAGLPADGRKLRDKRLWATRYPETPYSGTTYTDDVTGEEIDQDTGEVVKQAKRGRGRPKGAKNRPKINLPLTGNE